MDSHEQGIITRGEANIIVRAFEFADKRAEDIMIPAAHVDFISLSRSLHENLAVATKHRHSRLPLVVTLEDVLESLIGDVRESPLHAERATERTKQPLSRPT